MEIIEESQQGIQIYKLKGRLDSMTSPDFEKALFNDIEAFPRNMVFDFEELDYISSAGLRVILKATKALKKQKRDIILCAMKDYVKEVFEISGFDTFLRIEPSREDAIRNL